jgi:hypothetical protein
MHTISMHTIRNNHKGYWFEPGAMRFFRTRLPAEAYLGASGGVAYFITSEKGPDGRRLYSVRRYSFTEDTIDTVGAFQGYQTRGRALSALRRALMGVES